MSASPQGFNGLSSVQQPTSPQRYFHGTKSKYSVGDAVVPGIVSPDDLREMVWVTTDLADAKYWAKKGRYTPVPDPDGLSHVYEVTVDAGSVTEDTNHPGYRSGEVTNSWMTGAATVVREVAVTDPVSGHWADGANTARVDPESAREG